MSSSSYSKINRRGFRLHPIRRFSVQKLKSRLVYLFRFVRSKWRSCSSSYGQTFQSLKKGSMSSRRRLVVVHQSSYYSRSRPTATTTSFCRSNSFYSEAIADCLDFIKTSSSSFSVDHKHVSPR
ncbi:hypothetical protein M5689_014263 [Euphorbia peplus]|nr:hypothetical protein M5689_014263 [Euphorbia peplus]